ncbi:MAG: hypothetical protein J7K98_00030 [Candidatus Aenigmarchaeota archaeon]|nr:hypothetical protein [Candidatus Aenigmarchaeota archaeon]
MGIFGTKKKSEEEKPPFIEFQKIIDEIKVFKGEFRILHEKLERKIDANRNDYIQYLYHIVTQLESIEKQLGNVSNDLKKVSELIEEKFKQLENRVEELEATVNVDHEGEMKMFHLILQRFTKIIEVFSNILKKELDIAREKMEKELSKPVDEE